MGSVSSTITLVDQMSSALSSIESNVNSLKSTLQSLEDEGEKLNGASFNGFIESAEKAGKRMTEIGKEMSLALTAPLLLLGKEMYGDAVEYESAFAGVQKTVTGTKEEYDALYSDLLHISETNPTGFTESAKIMEMAGQLGVAKEELTGFTEAYIKLQETTNILGDEGAEDLARFLNVTEKTTENIERIGGVIVGLGNNNATTEREILSMATKIGATGDLAGFSAREILALSAALSSVGINAEAGGTAAGKLMKKMQLAAEVGGSAQEKLAAAGYEFSSGLDFVNALSSMKKGDIADIASALGTTVDAVQDLGNNWLALEQFSEVMGITGKDFLSGWKDSPAQSMLKFFQGLGNLDPESGNSVLAQLAEMDLTEVRLSNLIAAMAGNSEILQTALEEAYRQYDMNPAENAMAEEVAKRYETTESQNEMLKNKLHNTMANFGDNLIRALEPVLKMANDILEAFNKLSETDQSAILTGLAVLAALGPGLTIVGGALKAIATAAKAIKGIGNIANLLGFGNGAGSAAKGAAQTGSTLVASWITGIKNAITQKMAEFNLANLWNGAFFADWFTHNTNVGRSVTGQQSWEETGTAFENWQRQVEQNIKTFSDDWTNLWKTITGQNEEQPVITAEPKIELPPHEEVQQTIQDKFGTTDPILLDVLMKENPVKQPGEDGYWSSSETPESVIQLPEVATPQAESGGMVVGMGFGFGFTQGVEAQTDTINMAANSLSTGAVESAVATLNNGAVPAASAAMSSAAVSAAEGILSSGAGSAIGRNFMAGLAAGIRSGGGAAIAAAAGVAASIKSIVSSILKIHSPSRVAYWQGEMTMLGFANGIDDGGTNVLNIVKSIFDDVKETWNDETWNLVGEYANTEAQALADTFNHVKDGVKVNDSDIKKIRTLAEREVINHFTTAEVKVEMTNNNNISSDMDIDGIIAQLEDKVTERLEAVAEGVYS